VKLTHRDFRPLRRSKYVAQPLKRRPTLRILALAALGIAVYLKYDSVVNSRFFQNLRQPRRLVDAMLPMLYGGAVPAAVPAAEGLAWSADSALVDADCRDTVVTICLDRWQTSLGSETIGTLRGILAKASMQWDVEPAHGIKARFIRALETADPPEGPSPSLELSRLEILGGKESLVLEHPAGDGAAAFCDKRRCLDSNPPRMPFARYRITEKSNPAGPESPRPPGSILSLIPLEGIKANPILRGRVVEVPTESEPDQWLKIYHGADIFSYYRGLSNLGPAIKPGAMIESGETLGQVSANGDSAGVLDVRIEKAGVLIDPREFLGIAPEAVANAPETETLHVR
jgi:hypothetical protein